MMNNVFRTLTATLALCSSLASCSWDASEQPWKDDGIPLRLQCDVTRPVKSSDTGFDEGDLMGVYVVNYRHGEADALAAEGNHAHNAPFRYDAAQGAWISASEEAVCWKDLLTPADIYGYYPYQASTCAPDAVFSVRTDQRSSLSESDLLWGKAAGIQPRADAVDMTFGHLFSKVQVSVNLSEAGEASDSEDLWLEFPGVCTSAQVHLDDGSLQAMADSRQTVTPCKAGNCFEAILIPQTLSEDSIFFRIHLAGHAYSFSTDAELVGGRLYRFDVAVHPAALRVSINQIDMWELTPPITLEASGTARDDDATPGGTPENAAVQADREALVVLYRQTGGENWKNSGNWCTDAPLSTWKGVSVNEAGRVRILNLSNNNLSGSIPACIGQLTGLTSLQLYGNQLAGSVPDELFGLTGLTSLGLYKNQLSGTLSRNVESLSLLNSLNLSQNLFSGEIPAGIGLLSKLNTLNLSQNRFSGAIPDSLGLLTRMSALNLSENMLTGNLPASLAAISVLKTLNVSGNRLSGQIPTAYVEHTSWSIWNPDLNILPQQDGFGLWTDKSTE